MVVAGALFVRSRADVTDSADVFTHRGVHLGPSWVRIVGSAGDCELLDVSPSLRIAARTADAETTRPAVLYLPRN
jgi:hypothetical protein